MSKLCRFYASVVLSAALPWAAAAPAFAADTATPAAAEDPARALFRQAQALLEQGQLSQACDTFERSLVLKDGVGTKFNLALCWEQLGKTASAHALFTEVLEATRALGQAERAAAAKVRVSALEANLSRVIVEVKSDAPGLIVKRDGEVLPAELWGKPLALDPGKHRLEAGATGKQPLSIELDVPQGPVLMPVVLALAEAPAEPAPAPVAVAEPEPASALVTPVPEDGRDAGAASSGRAVLTYSLAGVGVIGLAVGATMGQQFYALNEDAKTICPSSRNCTPEEIRQHAGLLDDARRARTWTWVSGGIGLASLTTAAVLWFTESEEESEAGLKAAPWVTAEGWGGSVGGRF